VTSRGSRRPHGAVILGRLYRPLGNWRQGGGVSFLPVQTAICDMVAHVSGLAAKTILIAHRQAAVRDRFAVALADAHHEFVIAESAQAATEAARTSAVPLSLALIDMTLADEPIAFVQALRDASATALPIIVFSGTIGSVADIPLLTALNVGYINEHAGTPQILPALAPHLFPDNFNRRMNLRLAIGVPVTYRTEETLAGAVTLDVGKGGLAIRTMNPLPKGTAVQVKFKLPGLAAEIDASGRVAWSDQKVGMGVQFEQVSSSHQRTIDGFLDAHC
jgi:uncharacterized protein (TIGR02266 family)